MDGCAARRVVALAIAVLAMAGARAQPAPRPFAAALGFGLVCEKGGSYARCAPATRAELSWSFGAGPLDMRVGVSGAIGALFGQVLEVGAQAAVAPRLVGRWRPAIGLCLAADCGSSIYYATDAARASSVPPAAMAYAGLVLSPLEFRDPSGWGLSFLESRLSLGAFGFPRSVRGEIGLIALKRSF